MRQVRKCETGKKFVQYLTPGEVKQDKNYDNNNDATALNLSEKLHAKQSPRRRFRHNKYTARGRPLIEGPLRQ